MFPLLIPAQPLTAAKEELNDLSVDDLSVDDLSVDEYVRGVKVLLWAGLFSVLLNPLQGPWYRHGARASTGVALSAVRVEEGLPPESWRLDRTINKIIGRIRGCR